jgi:hypothetical protein
LSDIEAVVETGVIRITPEVRSAARARDECRPPRLGSERLPSSMRVHVVGAGPVGLLLTALLQSMEGVTVRLYEKRREYTRTRMVQLAPYLVADSVESYRGDLRST